jgi:hypothetical protein
MAVESIELQSKRLKTSSNLEACWAVLPTAMLLRRPFLISLSVAVAAVVALCEVTYHVNFTYQHQDHLPIFETVTLLIIIYYEHLFWYCFLALPLTVLTSRRQFTSQSPLPL